MRSAAIERDKGLIPLMVLVGHPVIMSSIVPLLAQTPPPRPWRFGFDSPEWRNLGACLSLYVE